MNLQAADIRDAISAKTTREWVERARALKPLLEASAAEIEQSRTIPACARRAHRCPQYAALLGGAELDPATHALAAIAEAMPERCIAQARTTPPR